VSAAGVTRLSGPHAWRFLVCRCEIQQTQRAMRLAYADPPYPGLAHYYPEKREADHPQLVSRLAAYDGWALSTSHKAL